MKNWLEDASLTTSVFLPNYHISTHVSFLFSTPLPLYHYSPSLPINLLLTFPPLPYLSTSSSPFLHVHLSHPPHAPRRRDLGLGRSVQRRDREARGVSSFGCRRFGSRRSFVERGNPQRKRALRRQRRHRLRKETRGRIVILNVHFFLIDQIMVIFSLHRE